MFFFPMFYEATFSNVLHLERSICISILTINFFFSILNKSHNKMAPSDLLIGKLEH